MEYQTYKKNGTYHDKYLSYIRDRWDELVPYLVIRLFEDILSIILVS
jgi:hypothetical protein